jgi:CxxC motif-containing protein (DUF1111 family)
MRKEFLTCLCCAAVSAGSLILVSTGPTPTVYALGVAATDPGVRSGAANAGAPLSGLSASELAYFQDGSSRFTAIDSVSGTIAGETDSGLGPAYNANSCGSCHSQPATGGTSPSNNPQVAAANVDGATNTIPDFITADGPVREPRFPFQVTADGRLSQTPDGGVHDAFTIAGRSDAPGCNMAQPDFAQMELLGNLIFRIPTPIFGAGLIENIPEAALYANMAANPALKQVLGISGHPNISGNDGTITRFGWKAQNKSLEMFAGEAYNVEMVSPTSFFPTNGCCLPPLVSSIRRPRIRRTFPRRARRN